jgi:hypothetical protein
MPASVDVRATNQCLTICTTNCRRLFLGDEGGNVLLVNTINGTLLNKVKLISTLCPMWD